MTPVEQLALAWEDVNLRSEVDRLRRQEATDDLLQRRLEAWAAAAAHADREPFAARDAAIDVASAFAEWAAKFKPPKSKHTYVPAIAARYTKPELR